MYLFHKEGPEIESWGHLCQNSSLSYSLQSGLKLISNLAFQSLKPEAAGLKRASQIQTTKKGKEQMRIWIIFNGVYKTDIWILYNLHWQRQFLPEPTPSMAMGPNNALLTFNNACFRIIGRKNTYTIIEII